MTSDDVLTVSIDELVLNFRSALVALVPAAERAKMIWSDVMNQHADWEHLQACLFEVFVGRPLGVDRDRVEDEFSLARYDIDLGDYSRSSWIACRPKSGNEFAFVRFLSKREPFDEVEGVLTEPPTLTKGRSVKIPLGDATFSYMRHMPDGRIIRVQNIEAIA
jgi:hypothetical protein